jgi:RNA ligase (TIGR02306 family)
VLSFGLLVPAPEGSAAGDDVTETLGVTHWNPPEAGEEARCKTKKPPLFEPADRVTAPDVPFVKYDLEAGRKYARRLFVEGEQVLVTEKCHGQSSRYVFLNGTMHCSSRTQWKREYPDYSHVTVELLAGKVDDETAQRIVDRLRNSPAKRDTLWQALENAPSLRKFCEANAGIVVYGEVLGVQDLKYGLRPGEVSFVAFDLMDAGRWVDGRESRARLGEAGVPQVPVLHDGPFDFDLACSLAEGATTVRGASHVREGCVVKLPKERQDENLGRACLKFVGCGYYERKQPLLTQGV